MSRKICVVTGTRAEFGMLRWLMQEISHTDGLTLQVVATGMHLSPEYGLTQGEIEKAGFEISYKVEMLLGANTASAVTKSMGVGMIGFADALVWLRPDILVVLGDRFELIPAVVAALIAGVPVAHLHGGETTEGAFDEAIRHSITKMAHLHFVAAEEYARRVVQLGESPKRVFTVGGLGVDALQRMRLLTRKELETSLDFEFGSKNLLITFHPVTLEGSRSSDQLGYLLAALDELEDTRLIFTMPNADSGGHHLASMVADYVRSRSNTRAYQSLGHLRYLSCMRHVDGVVGNSSSGLTEAPSLGVGTVDIGDRQKGRIAATSVIHCEPNLEAIRSALARLYHPEFRQKLHGTRNPYGLGGACSAIARRLKEFPLEGLVKKAFFDMPSDVIDQAIVSKFPHQ